MYLRLIPLIIFATLATAPLLAQTAPSKTATTNVETQSALPPALAPAGNVSTQRENSENWSALPLAESGLPVEFSGAVLLGRYETPQFTRELLQAEWRLGDPIDLYVVRPHGVTNPPVILYLYNYTSDTDRFRDDGWCKRATENGFAAVGFVSALSGQRFHSPRPMKQWFVSELQEALASSTHDVQMVLNYLETRGDLDMKNVGMFGQESGGAIAVLAAAADTRITALDVINPWGDWPDWLKESKQIPDGERATYMTPEFLHKVVNLDPISYLPTLHLHALRVQQVKDNLITPPIARDKIAAAVLYPQQLVQYKDVSELAATWHSTGLSGWLRAQMRSASVAASKLEPSPVE